MDSRGDGQLLADVAASQSQEAFAELMRRHGAMVFNECLRLLSDRHEAEDVTQAVFLVLWTKAQGLRHRPSVAPWLHRVTRNVCRNAWRSNAARKTKERKAMEAVQRNAADDDLWNEIKDVLDEELDRLSEKYRLPLILFHFEGRQIEEIARLTNTKAATVASLLQRARELLRGRISRRGITVGTVGLLAAVDVHAQEANLSASFAANTLQHAGSIGAGGLAGAASGVPSISLAQGALKMLAVSKIKFVTTIIASAVIAVGVLGTATFMILLANPSELEVDSKAEQQTAEAPAVSETTAAPLDLQTIIATLEKQREQVKSLNIEIAADCTTLVPLDVLRSWKRFEDGDFTYQHKIHFAYKEGKRYQVWISTTERSPDRKTQGQRRVSYHGEKGADSKGAWERRVDLESGPAQVFVMEPHAHWITNPAYCMNFGWDCKTELFTQDAEALKHLRSYDLISLLKKGAFALDAKTQQLDGVSCAVLRRTYEQQIIEDDADREKPRFAKATETVWLDVDHGFALRQRDMQNDVWGLDRTTNAELVEILPGVWFPRKSKVEPHAPLDAAKEYQGRPALSWNENLVRWSVNDVADKQFDIVTKPSDLLYGLDAKVMVIDDAGQPVDPTADADTPSASSPPAAEPLTVDEEQFVEALTNAAAMTKNKLRVAIASGPGCDSANTFIRLLKKQATCKVVSLADIGNEGTLKPYDVLLIPGGYSGDQKKALGESGRRVVREFVKSGGGYVGVCAGAGLATTNLEGGLGIVNAELLLDKKQTPGPDGEMTVHMNHRGSATVKMELTDVGRKVFDAPAGLIDTEFLAGPVLRQGHRDDLPRCIALGSYRSEVWLHKLQRGTMVDTPNVLAARYGKGKVIVFSSHPEVRTETESMLVRAVLAASRQSD